MSRGRSGRHGRVAVATMAMAAAMVGVDAGPAHAASAVRGSAFGYYSNVSLFGGPYNLRGYGQPAGSDTEGVAAMAGAPAGGGTVSLTDADGSMAAYGPAVIFGWYNESTETYGSTGAQTVTASGTISGSGSVMSRSTVNNAGPGPLVMPQIVTTCSRSGATTQITVQVSNGFVETSTHPSTGAVTSTQAIPANPLPGTQISGTLNHIGDSFTVVFNEQSTNADGSKTVIGAHMYLNGPTAVGHLVVASATCGVTP
jgi:hypothetical protein